MVGCVVTLGGVFGAAGLLLLVRIWKWRRGWFPQRRLWPWQCCLATGRRPATCLVALSSSWYPDQWCVQNIFLNFRRGCGSTRNINSGMWQEAGEWKLTFFDCLVSQHVGGTDGQRGQVWQLWLLFLSGNAVIPWFWIWIRSNLVLLISPYCLSCWKLVHVKFVWKLCNEIMCANPILGVCAFACKTWEMKMWLGLLEKWNISYCWEVVGRCDQPFFVRDFRNRIQN